jgi:hypothetical protein
MAICKKFGYPDLFLTFTCNPKWPEIQRHMEKSGNYSIYRPDITCRVFQIKLKQMMSDFRQGQFFGRVIASKYFIFLINLIQSFFKLFLLIYLS